MRDETARVQRLRNLESLAQEFERRLGSIVGRAYDDVPAARPSADERYVELLARVAETGPEGEALAERLDTVVSERLLETCRAAVAIAGVSSGAERSAHW